MIKSIGGWVNRHPRFMLAACGAALALQVYELTETTEWLAQAFRAVRESELASDAARMASEAMGG